MNQNRKDLLGKFKNKKLLTQLFTVMITFSALLMAVVSMVVTHQTTATFINNNNLVYSNALYVSLQTLDTLFSGFHNSLTHITYDAGIVDSVVTPKRLPSSANDQVWSILNGYCQETEAIDEIYLYVRKTDAVFTSTYEKCLLEDFREKDLIAKHMSGRSATSFLKSGRTTSIELYKGNIYMVRDFPLNGEKRLGTLFMKMKPSILYDSLEGSQTSFSLLFAYDNDWNPLFPGMLDYSILPEEAARDIPFLMEQGKNTLYFENQHYFFSQSDKTSIRLVLLVNDFAFMPSFGMVLKNSLPFFALILVLNTLLSACVLYLSYMPVQKLKKMISSEEHTENNESTENEWNYLTESFLKISSHKQQLDYILSDMIPKISKEFYFDLLNGKPMDSSYIQNILTNINSPLQAEGECKTIVLTFKKPMETAEKDRLLEHFMGTLAQCLGEISRYVMQQIDESLYAVILQYDGDTALPLITGLEVKLEQIFFDNLAASDHAWLEIGPKCSSLQQVSFSYLESVERLAHRKYPSKQTEGGVKSPQEDFVVPNHRFFQLQLKSISGFVMKGDIESARQKALHICHTLALDSENRDLFRAYEFYRLAFLNVLASYRIAETDQEEYAFVFDPEPYSADMEYNPVQMEEYMERFCIACVSLLGEKYQKQQHKYLIRARHYIEENFTNPDLSLNLLAEQCRTTTSYLSRLFKESFGINFVDYLNQYRIEKAKELLLTTDKPVKEISMTTGFNSQQNFIRVFKKHTGMTPGQFKSQEGAGKQE